MEDVSRNRLCGCHEIQFSCCPRPDLLTLHTISKMPVPTERAVTQRVNITRQGPEQSRWKASPGAVICNVHYKDFIGCSRNNRNLVPVHFKKPNSALIPPASQKVRIRGTSAEEDENASYSANQTSLPTGELDPQLDTAGLSSGYLHPAQPQFDTKDTGSTTQLRNIEPCLEPEINFTNQPIGELDSQPAVGVRSDPAGSQLYSPNNLKQCCSTG